MSGRITVRSADGTPLAVWVEGTGPPLVMVHGSLSDHTRFDPLVAALRGHMRTYAMDRRGFGASGDNTPCDIETPNDVEASYDIEREFEDVAAVVGAVAADTGGPVALWGHSYGASCAMGGAARTADVSHVVLYEPSLGLTYPPGSIEGVEAALARGDAEAAIRLVIVDILEMGDEVLDEMRTGPLWPMRIATAPTVPRECRAEQAWIWRPGEFHGITAQALVLAGSESPEAVAATTRRAASAIPGSVTRVLDGHGHMAHQTDPAMVAEIILGYVAHNPNQSASTG